MWISSKIGFIGCLFTPFNVSLVLGSKSVALEKADFRFGLFVEGDYALFKLSSAVDVSFYRRDID